MRIWSLHPKYLDTKGLVALWRETLLAKHVLEGKTKGYKNHPQLSRFKKAKYPVDSINQYLSEVYLEAVNREYNFDKKKIDWNFKKSELPVTKGQVDYEVGHLLIKLKKRDLKKYKDLKSKSEFDHHPIFNLTDGEVEEWEVQAGSPTLKRKKLSKKISTMKIMKSLLALFLLGLMLTACSKQPGSNQETTSKDLTKETFALSGLVDELKQTPDSIIAQLNRQHHSLKVLERRSVPGPFTPPKMKFYSDYAVNLDKLPTINPGPGEYVHVMEGQRNGYNNLTIGITETFPGGAPPMHSHEGEESHVLLEGDIVYALGDTLFTIKGPYVVNIPAGVPHAFKNIGNKTANLVVIFPTNIWKYDVLDFFPFEGKNYSAKFDKLKKK